MGVLDKFKDLIGIEEIDDEMLEELASSVNVERLNNHPVKLSKEEIKEAYRRSMTPLCGNERQACVDIWRYYGGKSNE